MFNVGGWEVVVIALIALIAVGPEQLPGVLRKIGGFVSQAKQMSGALRTEFMEGMEPLNSAMKEGMDSFNDGVNSVTNGVSNVTNEINPTNWMESDDNVVGASRGDGSTDSPIVPPNFGVQDEKPLPKFEDIDNPFKPLPGTPGGAPLPDADEPEASVGESAGAAGNAADQLAQAAKAETPPTLDHPGLAELEDGVSEIEVE